MRAPDRPAPVRCALARWRTGQPRATRGDSARAARTSLSPAALDRVEIRHVTKGTTLSPAALVVSMFGTSQAARRPSIRRRDAQGNELSISNKDILESSRAQSLRNSAAGRNTSVTGRTGERSTAAVKTTLSHGKNPVRSRPFSYSVGTDDLYALCLPRDLSHRNSARKANHSVNANHSVQHHQLHQGQDSASQDSRYHQASAAESKGSAR
jgi:hypothetical protein